MVFLREVRLIFGLVVFIGLARLKGLNYPLDTKFLTASVRARVDLKAGVKEANVLKRGSSLVNLPFNAILYERYPLNKLHVEINEFLNIQ